MPTYKKVPEDEYGSYSWLVREVGGYLGFGFNPSSWDTNQAEKVNSIVQSGIMQFYYHPPMKDEDGKIQPHKWSFLSPVAELEIESGTRIYDLPDDFSGVIGDFTVGE